MAIYSGDAYRLQLLQSLAVYASVKYKRREPAKAAKRPVVRGLILMSIGVTESEYY